MDTKFKNSSLFQKVYNNQDSLEYLRAIYSSPKPIEWKGYAMVPAGSFIDLVCKIFFANTNIPLEIPLYTSLSLISAILLEKNTQVDFVSGEVVRPDVWIVVLSDSGSGKSYTLNHLTSIAQVKEFPECSSSARFVQELATHNRSIWIRDEFSQFLKSIEEQGYLREMKDYFLRVFDGKKITRNTKQEQITVEEPALSILGLSVGSTFLESLTLDSILDGFAQRFQYVIAKTDLKRPFSDFPIWTVGEYKEEIVRAWNRLWSTVIHKKYIFSFEAIDAFKLLFKQSIDPLLPESFYRRIIFRLAKYSLIYHILLNKEQQYIDAEDVEWAGRLVITQLEDARQIIEERSSTEIGKKIRAVENLARRLGRTPNLREVVQGIYSIRNVQEAYSLLKIANFDVSNYNK